jgi:hypothetical protein
MTEPEAIASRLHRFYRLVDQGVYEEAWEFFTTDGLLVYGPGSPGPGAQRGGEILEAFQARRNERRPPQRHVASNLTVEPHPDGVTAQSVLTVYKFADGVVPAVALVADIVQHWREDRSQWKMSEMHIRPVGATAAA